MRSVLTRLMANGGIRPAGVLLLVFVLLEVGSLRHMTLTRDEPDHYAFGWHILNREPLGAPNTNMPFSVLNALPRKLASTLHDGPVRRHGEAFAQRAAALGIAVAAHRLLDWVDQDYGPVLREIAALGPDALYVGVRFAVGVKIARQAPAILPAVHLLSTEGLYNRALPIQARAGGAEGWHVTNVGPDPAQSSATRAWAARYRTRFGAEPSAYSLTAYTAVTIIAAAVEQVVKAGRPVTRGTVRDAIQATRLPDALVGPVAFDADGDLERPAISVYEVRGGAFRHVETIFTDGVKDGGTPTP